MVIATVNAAHTTCNPLARIGIQPQQFYHALSACLNCNEMTCGVSELTDRTLKHTFTEVWLQCRGCQDTADITLKDGRVNGATRFLQVEDKIYHMKICGECKVFRV